VVPNADGRQAGLTYLDAAGAAHETHPLASDFTGCTHPDPDHSYDGGRVQYDDGAMDGFLRSGENDEYAIGFYVEEDRPFYSAPEEPPPTPCLAVGEVEPLAGNPWAGPCDSGLLAGGELPE